MTQHLVKCLYCGQVFDAQPQDENKIWIKPRSNRYAHKNCAEKKDQAKTQEEKDFEKFYQYVKKEQGKNFNFVQFKKVTDAWKKDHGYSYNGMLKTLLYFYEVKGNSKHKLREGSIGIIPFQYQQAYNYYYEIYMNSLRAGTGNYNSTKSKEIEILTPVSKTIPPKLFNTED